MKRILIQFGKQYLYWFCFFVFFRVLFLLTQWTLSAQLSWQELLGTFWHGMPMDLSFSGYLMIIPGLLLCMKPWLPQLPQKISNAYTLFFLLLLTLLGLSDIGLYPEWNTRIGAHALDYLKTPKGVIQCLTWWQWMIAICCYALIVTTAYWIYRRTTREEEQISNRSKLIRTLQSSAQTLITAALIIPIRGGLDSAPLNLSAAYFSQNLYANYAAYNYAWAFMYSVTHTDADAIPVSYMTDDEAMRTLREHAYQPTDSIPIHLKQLPNHQQPNVIIVLLESYTARAMGCYNANNDLTPNLSKWAKEGINWTQCYANGDRSDKGFSAIFANYPPLIQANSIIEHTQKLQTQKLLPNYFQEKGYHMHYFYGGDVDFYNNKVLLVQGGVDHIVERSDFPLQEQVMQKWGVPDEYLWNRTADELLQSEEPYFAGTYNISTHPPFDLPMQEQFVSGNSEDAKYANAMRYSDSCLNNLLQRLKNSPQWDHTLVIITSDHTCPLPLPSPAINSPESYHIPMIWLGGMIQTPQEISTICSQVDLTTTLMQQLQWQSNPNPFAKNMFGSDSYAFYIRNEFWGYISSEGTFSFNLDNGQMTTLYGKADTTNIHYAKAWIQALHNDFHKR